MFPPAATGGGVNDGGHSECAHASEAVYAVPDRAFRYFANATGYLRGRHAAVFHKKGDYTAIDAIQP